MVPLLASLFARIERKFNMSRSVASRKGRRALGNETQFSIWIEFFLHEKVIAKRQEGGHYYYRRTERGEFFHKLLRSGNLVKLFNNVSGRRVRH